MTDATPDYSLSADCWWECLKDSIIRTPNRLTRLERPVLVIQELLCARVSGNGPDCDGCAEGIIVTMETDVTWN